MNLAALRIPTGNAVCVEAVSSDALTATREAWLRLVKEVNPDAITHLTLTTVLVDPTAEDCWETTAYASLAE